MEQNHAQPAWLLRVVVAFGGAILALAAAFALSDPPLAFGAGSAYPSGCDSSLDIYTHPYWEGSPPSFWGTCWTSKTIGYTASGLSAWVQASVSGDGFTTAVDGYFGSGTDSKVKQWQTWRGITSDGIVGNDSWIRMDEFGSIKSWDTFGSCSSSFTGWQVLTNGSELAIRTCSGGFPNNAPPMGQGEYCIQDRYGFYTIANRTDPSQWRWIDDCTDFE